MKWLDKLFHLVAVVILGFFFIGCTQTSLTDEVNVFIGTGGHGHTYPGAAAPFGMMQLSPDTREKGWDGCSGYHYSDDFIYGFSHTHLSGTGVGDYADILMLPMSGNAKEIKTDSTGRYGSHFSHEEEYAEPGYYRVFLDDYGVEAELTTTQRCGMHRYTFNSAANSRVLIDLKYRDLVLDSKMEIVSDTMIKGYRFSSGWARNQKLFFVIKFSRPFTKIGFLGQDSLKEKQIAEGKDIRALFHFDINDGEELLIKIGISAVDEEGAAKNLKAEIPGWDFVEIKDKTSSVWEKELSKIEIKTNDVEDESIFYTSLYHSFLAPNIYSDIDGRYRGRDLKIHKADFNYYTVFSLWDTYRTEHPLFTIIDQKRTVDFIRTFIRQYEEGGLLPVWELSANETNCMIGYHAIPVIADAITNGIEGFDYEKAFEAMKASADQDIPELNLYKSMGYIPSDEIGASVSKTLEYAYDDWCIARVAQILNKTEDFEKYSRRAEFYKNLFDASTLKMRPRVNGGWKKPFDPREVDFNFTEANSWQYSFYVPQDLQNLIAMSGGDESFITNLDSLFGTSSETTGRKQSDITGLIGQYAHGNEPSHHIAYLYSYAGASWKTQAMAARILREMYHDKPDGISGNEDCGQMSAWYVMSSLGFYSVQPASGIYVLGSPKFKEATLHLENGKSFTIKRNGSGDYISKAKLNGKEYLNSFITFATIQKGGKLELTMSEEPNKEFGKAKENRPPSYINPTLLPAPVIKNNSYVFYDSLLIDFLPIEKGEIIISINDGELREFTKSFYITENTKLTFKTQFKNQESTTVVSRFYKGKTGRSIKLESSYSNQYSGGGDSAMIDFMRGSTHFTDGKWQGYEGQDLTAIIDLGKIQNIHKVSAGFYQDINSWIWLPKFVFYSFSKDGQNFDNPIKVDNPIDPKTEGAIIQEFSTRCLIKRARYVKIYAKGIIDCPAWHRGYEYQGKAWLFVDEVTIYDDVYPKIPIVK